MTRWSCRTPPRFSRLALGTIALAALLSSCAAVLPIAPYEPEEEHPRIFRSVLDGRPRMLTVDLGQERGGGAVAAMSSPAG